MPRAADGSQTVTLSNQPEVHFTLVPSTITTGSVPTHGAHLSGVEAALNWSRIFIQSEAYALTIDGTGPGRSQTTAGSYIEAAYLFAGKLRQWQPGEGGWRNPRPEGGFGALEASLRYSYADVHGLPGKGGRQGVYAAVLNWYPVGPLRFTLGSGHGRVQGGMAPRSVDFAVVRGQISY